MFTSSFYNVALVLAILMLLLTAAYVEGVADMEDFGEIENDEKDPNRFKK